MGCERFQDSDPPGQSRYGSDAERRAARRDMWAQRAQTATAAGPGEQHPAGSPRGDAP
jgi:hypothetical protein